jgi:hypothetical protein
MTECPVHPEGMPVALPVPGRATFARFERSRHPEATDVEISAWFGALGDGDRQAWADVEDWHPLIREQCAVLDLASEAIEQLTAERDMLDAELRGVHGELTAAGIKGDPENHWAPLMVSMLARDRRVTAAELASVRERADFYEVERDRERLAAEHHRTAYVELEAEADERIAQAVKAERERIRAAVAHMKFTLFRQGTGTGQTLDMAVVPLDALLALLGPEPDGDSRGGSGEAGLTA